MIQKFLAKLKRNPIFIGFTDAEDVFGQFQVPFDKDKIMCYAYYDYEDYEGRSTVFFYDRKTKKYYEVYASHCSCAGLEDQFEPEEIVMKELQNRLDNGYLADEGTFKKLYQEFKKV